MTQDEVFEAVLKDEGGWTNHPDDNGGATKFGVLYSEWQKWKAPKKVSLADFKKITKEDAKLVFKQWYWLPLRCSEMPPGVAYMVFDCGLLHGIFNAARWLQLSVDAKVDGDVGPKTLAALAASDPAEVITSLHHWRMKRIKGHEDYKVFGRGWINRALRVKKKALACV